MSVEERSAVATTNYKSYRVHPGQLQEINYNQITEKTKVRGLGDYISTVLVAVELKMNLHLV